MKGSLLTFKQEILLLKEYIKGLDASAQALKDLEKVIKGLEADTRILEVLKGVLAVGSAPGYRHLDEDTQNVATGLRDYFLRQIGSKSRRRFEYASIVIGLYGILEQYVENLLQGYLTLTCSLVLAYKDLPEAIRKNHVQFTMDLIGKLDYQKYKNKITTEFLVGNLHACLSVGQPYHLNIDAFVHHSANFRAENIESYFSRVGVSAVLAGIREHPVFIEHYEKSQQAMPPPNASNDTLFSPINDLAERRNEVAHGSLPSEMLSNELLLGITEFVEAYGVALFDVVRRFLTPLEVSRMGILLGKPIQVYDGSIVCLYAENIALAKGDWLIARPVKPNAHHLEGQILEIQIDGNPYDAVEPQTKTAVALRVSYNAKKSHEFYLVKKDDRAD